MLRFCLLVRVSLFFNAKGATHHCIYLLLTSASLNAANYIRIYYLPIYFQAIDNASPERSGILILALIVPTCESLLFQGFYSETLLTTVVFSVSRLTLTTI